MLGKEIVYKFQNLQTPFYYYDLEVLNDTCGLLKKEASEAGFKVHYAVKANANPRILNIIASYGFGADCVTFNEIECAIKAGFHSSDIVFAGVGKTDKEIEAALNTGIFCFNCESIAEIEVIEMFASRMGKIAPIALRINPNVEAYTHKYITTGVRENKFGINTWELEEVLYKLKGMGHIKLIGIHFHIGSQITKMSVFRSLCSKINELQDWFASNNSILQIINLGGGLGIDYDQPEKPAIFKNYIELIKSYIKLRAGQEIHIEPGRSLVGQCGTLISRVLYIKKGSKTVFAIIDAGMTDLLRPALYQARHKIENLSSSGDLRRYDVVGPVCESSDTFAQHIELPETKRGDIIAIRSAGAYGESMASRYNMRDLPKSVFSDEI